MSGLAYLQALAVLRSGQTYQPPARSLEPKPKRKLPVASSKHRQLTPKRISDAARMYQTNIEAGAALGCAAGVFSRLCYEYGIETPFRRKQRLREERGAA